jgi:hypothetical protein
MVRFGVYRFIECSVLTQSNESVFERFGLTLDKGPRTARFNVRLLVWQHAISAGRIDALPGLRSATPPQPTVPASRQPGGFLLGREPPLGRQMIDYAR